MNRSRIVASPLADRRAVVRLALWSALAALPALVAGRSVALALDRGFLAGKTAVGIAWLLPMAAAGVIAALAARRTTPLVGELVEPFRDRLVRHVVVADLHRATSAPVASAEASALARLVGQTDSARDISASLLAQAFDLVATAAMAVIGLALLAPLAAALVLVPVVATVAVVATMVPSLARRTRRLLRADEALAATTTTVAVARRDIAACGAEDRALHDVTRCVDRRARSSRALARTGCARVAVSTIGGNAALIVLLAAAPWLTARGALSVGALIGAIVYVSANLQPALRGATDVLATSLVHLRVVLRNLAANDTASAAAAATVDRRVVVLPAAPALRADGLTFAHGVGARRIVDGLDLTIAAGRHVAIVGPSGVGKSTLVDLLAGLRAPDGGRMSIGGLAFERLPDAGLRALIAVVPQEAYVFAGSLRDNLTYLDGAATDDELRTAIAATGLRELADRLGGLDGPVDPGELSEGQRQLVVATRVWLSPAAVVILDEATSRLDPAAEARVEAAFRRRPGTLIVVAHRLSSARRAEEVLLMDGTGIARGTHDELLVNSAVYAELMGRWTQSSTARISVVAGASV